MLYGLAYLDLYLFGLKKFFRGIDLGLKVYVYIYKYLLK